MRAWSETDAVYTKVKGRREKEAGNGERIPSFHSVRMMLSDYNLREVNWHAMF